MKGLAQDLRFALRSLRKRPGFAAVAVITLGLGIGSATTVFSWFQRAVLDPLPQVSEAEEIVAVQTYLVRGGNLSLSYPDFLDYRDRSTKLAGMFATSVQPLGLTHGGEAERAWGLLVSANYFDVLGVRAAVGRTFLPEEGREAGGGAVVVLSHHYWQRRFGGDQGIVGKQVTLNTTSSTVVGVAPEGFAGTDWGQSFDVYVPLTMAESLMDTQGLLESRHRHWLAGYARLAPGVSREEAQAELGSIADALAREYPESSEGQRVALLPFYLDPTGGSSMLVPILGVMGGFTGLLLLVACANVANLLLARTSSRRREIAIRLANGASRARLVRQLVLESLPLAIGGGVAGAAVAWLTRGTLLLFAPPSDLPIALDIPMVPETYLFAALVALLTVLVFGLAPALQASRPDLVPALKEDITTSGGRKRSRFSRALVVGQVTLSLLLLVVAGLFVRSYRGALAMDLGFEPQGVLLASFDLQHRGYDSARVVSFNRELLGRLTGVAGVTSASVAQRVPLELGGSSAARITVDSYVPQPDERPWAYYNVVGPDYFRTMRTSILRGRELAFSDDETGEGAVVINESMAERYWSGGDAVGGVIQLGGRSYRVVGVARDSKYRALSEGFSPYMFFSVLQRPSTAMILHVRTDREATRLAAAVQQVIKELDPALPVYGIRSLTRTVGVGTFQLRMASHLLGVFGGLALVLSVVGLFGVLAQAVARRQREIGIRMALGSRPRRIFGMVVGEGLLLAGIGVVLGSAIAAAATRLLGHMLQGVSPWDPLVFGGVALFLGAVALLASALPAFRAARLDPMQVLRTE